MASPNCAAWITCRPQSASGLSPECMCLTAMPAVGGRRRRLEFQLRLAAFRATAIQRHAAVVGVVEVTRAGALVGICHRATARQAPRAGQRDRTVDAARTGRCSHHQTALLLIEVVRQLQQHAMRRARAGNARKRLILAPRHVRHAAIDACRNHPAGPGRRCLSNWSGSPVGAIPRASDPADRRTATVQPASPASPRPALSRSSCPRCSVTRTSPKSTSRMVDSLVAGPPAQADSMTR